jgi:hypothetical protein
MAKIGRPGLSGEKRIELWERWKAGQCASDIARDRCGSMDSPHSGRLGALALDDKSGGCAPWGAKLVPRQRFLCQGHEAGTGQLRTVSAYPKIAPKRPFVDFAS